MEFYRYADVQHMDRVHIYKYTYQLIKETAKGYWIDVGYPQKGKWVSKTSKKRYAYPTREEAKENFIARKKRQISILSGQLENAKAALYYVDIYIKLDK